VAAAIVGASAVAAATAGATRSLLAKTLTALRRRCRRRMAFFHLGNRDVQLHQDAGEA
jgi:hypothetical protein